MNTINSGSKIYSAMSKIMANVGAVGKNKKNTAPGQGGYSFRGIDDVMQAMQSVLAENKVFFIPTVLENHREERESRNGATLIYTILKIQFSFYAEDGSHVSCVTMGEAMDSGDKSCNKAMSAALKYALTQSFCIPTEEPKDTENETHEIKGRIENNRNQNAGIIKPLPANSIVMATPDQIASIKSELVALDYNQEQVNKFFRDITGKSKPSDLTADDIAKCATKIATIKQFVPKELV